MREISSDHCDEHGGDDHDGEDDEDNDDNRWHCHPSHDPCLREAPSSDAISLGLLYPGYNFSYPPIPSGHSGFLPLLLRKWASTLLLLFLRTDFKTGQIKRLINVILIAGNLITLAVGSL